jgi:predicted DsbA family dithiol-disulfide isomerase
VRLRQLRDDLPVPVELVHRAFLLRPEEQERRFSEYNLEHRRAARQLTGLPFALPPVGAPYPRSSFPALEAAAWVKRQHPDRFEAYDLAVYEAFFRDTRVISDPDVLADLAAGLDLDPTPLRAALETHQYREALWADYREALGLRINSIPTVLIGSTRISGAVPYEEYLRAARQSLETSERRSSTRTST